jgi:pilus assembly protein Flp/PilA
MLRYLKDESGASAAEYALVLALIAAAIIASLTTLGRSISHTLNVVSSNINRA